MAQQTINIGASPNDGTGTPLRTAFQYTNSNFSELYTATGPSGNNITVPGTATITGDLTVDTSTLKVDSANNRVGVNTATPRAGFALDVLGNVALGNSTTTTGNRLKLDCAGTAGNVAVMSFAAAGTNKVFYGLTGGFLGDTSTDALIATDAPGAAIRFYVSDTGTEAMRLNSTGLGVGVSPSYKLDASATTNLLRLTSANGNDCNIVLTQSGVGNWMLYNAATNGHLRFQFGGNDRMIVDTSGNVGIGVTPSAWLTGVKALDIGSSGLAAYSGGITHNAYFDNTDGRWEYKGTGAATFYNPQNGVHQWFVAASGIANNPITTFANAAMTLNASGNLLVARTGAGLDNTSGVTIAQSSIGMQTEGNATQIAMNRTTSDGTIVDIRRNNSTVGTIAVTTAGTTYNTTSDYRLKEAVQPLAGGLARVNALKPSIYKWKLNGSSGEGFIAHELAEVVPAAVTGAKDAVNEDGTVNPQGVDLSKVVPILVAAIKELTAEVNALKNA